MIRKSGIRFSEKIMLQREIQSMIWKKLAPDAIRGGIRFSGTFIRRRPRT
jgi:hypothetical protein